MVWLSNPQNITLEEVTLRGLRAVENKGGCREIVMCVCGYNKKEESLSQLSDYCPRGRVAVGLRRALEFPRVLEVVEVLRRVRLGVVSTATDYEGMMAEGGRIPLIREGCWFCSSSSTKLGLTPRWYTSASVR